MERNEKHILSFVNQAFRCRRNKRSHLVYTRQTARMRIMCQSKANSPSALDCGGLFISAARKLISQCPKCSNWLWASVCAVCNCCLHGHNSTNSTNTPPPPPPNHFTHTIMLSRALIPNNKHGLRADKKYDARIHKSKQKKKTRKI